MESQIEAASAPIFPSLSLSSSQDFQPSGYQALLPHYSRLLSILPIMMKKMKLGSASDINHGTEMELHPPIDVSEHFDGQRHRNWRRGVSFTNPRDLEGGTKYAEIHYNR